MAVVLITGCSSGFGHLTTLLFARKGDRVFASMRDLAKAGDLRDAAASQGLSVDLLQLDVTDASHVDRAVRQVLDAAGRIDVLVNNAGVGIQGPIEETDDDEIRTVFETNVYGPLRLVRAVMPSMRGQGSGRIINVSSLAGIVSAPGGGIYAASKFALEAATEALRYEAAQFGVWVVLIEPGGFATRFSENRIMARRFGEGSPYFERYQRFHGRMSGLPGRGEASDPQDVAESIYNAAHDPAPKLRYLVGNDAVAIAGMRRELDDDRFEQTVRQMLGANE